MNLIKWVKGSSATLICYFAVSALALGEDRFAVQIGGHDTLVIFGPKGDRAAEISVPTIAQTATAGDVSFQISYGKDSDGRLTAILTPSVTAPAALHFNVLGKAVDATNAVVTLTFTKDLKSVMIDPGYVGSVEVNSHRLRKHNLAEELEPTPAIAPAPVSAQAEVAVTQPSEVAAPITTSAAPVSNADALSAPSRTLAPATMASQLPSLLGKAATSETKVAEVKKVPNAVPAVADSNPEMVTKSVPFFWSEPVTAIDGTAPACAPDEIKLVELHGSATVTLPDGGTREAANGMTIPSGSSVATDEASSIAVFLGGVNSARMLPQTTVTVTQSFDGATRKNVIDLDHGAVFSRVGNRAGEVQDYHVHTAEGSTGAEYANMLAFRGTTEDATSGVKLLTQNLSLDFSFHHLLAWNPPAMANRMSDIVMPLLGAVPTYAKGSTGSVFFYAPNTQVDLNQVKKIVIASNQGNGQNSPNANNPDTILQGLLLKVLPFNTKLNTLLTDINSGNATAAETKFYHNLITVFFKIQVPAIAKSYLVHRTPGAQSGYSATYLRLLQDLNSFQVPQVTPF